MQGISQGEKDFAMDKQQFTLDRWTRYVLLAITILLTVIAVELWGGRPSMLATAQAQIPDTGAQLQQLIVESKRTNELLGQILDHLRTKPVKARMVGTDKQDKPGRGKKRAG